MLTDEHLLTKAKKLIESKINWGDSNDWTNQDFVALSEKIQEQLNIINNKFFTVLINSMF